MRRFVCKLLSCVLLALSIGGLSNVARATNYGDLWWNPAESGWGLQTSHQADSMFITFYVFGADRNGTWLNGLMAASTPGGKYFAGDLYQATGPYYGGAFAPPAVNRKVGTVSFQALSATRATVTYTVDGVTVAKPVERLTLAFHKLAGTYVGSFLSAQHNCANPAANGLFNGSGTFTVVHAPPAPAVTITAVLSDNVVNFSCTYQGTYDQLGDIGSIVGTYQCSSGQAGTWNANEIELSSLGGILGRYSATNAAQGCQITGGFGGLKN